MDVKATAVKAARKAGELLKGKLGRAGRVEYKGEVDIVTEMDRAAEDLIREEIKAAFPDHGILAEEGDEKKTTTGSRWIVDPLDGTTNYAHGFPFFCVSIAFEQDGVVEFGCVYNPVLDEMFTASKGSGALLNDGPISVSGVEGIDRGLLATGFPYDIRTSKEDNLDHFAAFAKRGQAIRRAGSAALDLCYVACGRFDGFWEMKLNPWDTAAGALVVAEAGGRVTDFSGGDFSVYGPEVLATNGLIHDEMLGILGG